MRFTRAWTKNRSSGIGSRWLPLALILGGFLLLFGLTYGQALAESTPPPPSMNEENTFVILPDLPPDATQAEIGEHVYILVCRACHGDLGRGLTAEWISQWHPDDQNCWQSKCHAPNHPPDGFEIPYNIPPVMGEDALVRFKTAFDLYQYIKSTMPMQDPDSMTEEKYLQVTAFLLAQNNMGDLSAPLTVDRAASMRLRSEVAVQPTAQTEVLIPAVSSPAEEPQPRSPVVWLLLAGGLAALASGLSAYARSRRNKPDGEN